MQVKGIKDDIKGIIFDMDGLLVNSEELYWQANIQVAEEEKLGTPRDAYLKLTGATVKEMQAFYHKYFKTDADRDRFIKRTDDLVWQWTDEGKLKLRPGVQEALDEFKKRGLQMAIASSNYEDVLQHFLWATGIRNYFDFYLGYLDVQKGHIKAKPAPDIYLAATKKMNLPKENIFEVRFSIRRTNFTNHFSICWATRPESMPTSYILTPSHLLCKLAGGYGKMKFSTSQYEVQKLLSLYL